MAFPPAWTKDTDIYVIRAAFAQLAAADAPSSHITEEDHLITTRDGAQITVRVYRLRSRPTGGDKGDGRPGMVMLHGGGFCVGGLESGARLSRFFAERIGGVAINVEYRLAPEFPFPTAVYDAYDALEWVANHTADLGINPARGLLVAGESAGADLALVAAYLWTEKGNTPRVTGVYSSVSSAASLQTVPGKYKSQFTSMDEFADAPVMSAEAADFIKSIYKPDPDSPLAYAVAVPNPSIMPKTYFQACGRDPFRDCTLIMEQVWRDAGVSTKIDVYPDMPHVFWALGLHIEETVKHEKDSEDGLVWLLN